MDPLIQLAERIARQTGRPVPTPNPDGPTTKALALLILRDPGATPESGANATGVLDPYANSDPTSTRQRNLLRDAGIDPSVCVWWNASPYHLGYKGRIRPEDSRVGARSIRDFVELCPDLRVVIALGEDPYEVCIAAGLSPAGSPRLIKTWHPLTRGRGVHERHAQQRAALAEASDLLR